MGISIGHILLVLIIVFVLFGAGKLPQVMAELARGLKAFKKGIDDEVSDSETVIKPRLHSVEHTTKTSAPKTGQTLKEDATAIKKQAEKAIQKPKKSVKKATTSLKKTVEPLVTMPAVSSKPSTVKKENSAGKKSLSSGMTKPKSSKPKTPSVSSTKPKK